MRMNKKWTTFSVCVLTAASVAGCGAGGTGGAKDESAAGKQVEIQFFQYKPEARGTFDELIKQFEAQNPNIKVVHNNPPDASTVLKTNVARGDVPDVIAIGGDNVYASLAQSGVFADFTGAPELTNIQEAYVQMIKDVAGTDNAYAIPYAANANGVIYNKTIFKELNLSVPKTWDEFIAICQKIQAAGKLPFYFTFKDSWTTLPSFNAIAASLQEDRFFEKRKAGQTTFAAGYKEIAEKYLQLMQYGQKDLFGKGYNDGNVAFANGESAMYLQGVWAIPEIKKANPNIELGVFPLPASNDPDQNLLVSGVDLLVTMSASTKHPEEAKKFINFLIRAETSKTYIDQQKSFSAVKGVVQEDASVSDLKPVIGKGAVADFPDHYIPSSMKLDQLLQEAILKKDADGFLKKMDAEWDKAQKR